MNNPAQIEVTDLSIGYDDNLVLSGVNFTIKKGSFTGIIGPNGSGKTTLLRSLTRFLPPESGWIILDGKELTRYRTRDLARKIGMVPQKWSTDFAFTTEEVVMMGRFPHQRRFHREDLDDWEIAREAMLTTNTLHLADRSVFEISGGEAQRVVIAQALAQAPAILLLDEPTAHLDISYQLEICELLKELNKEGLTIVMVLHDLNLAARYCQRLLLLKDGSVFAAGKVDEVLTEVNLRKVYGVRVRRRKDPLSGELIMDFYPENTLVTRNSSLVASMKESPGKPDGFHSFIPPGEDGVEKDHPGNESGASEMKVKLRSMENDENCSRSILKESKEKISSADLPEEEGNSLRKGLVQVYTGDGKGKTTAALGVGLRAVGWGLKVLMIQFIKGRETGELRAVEELGEKFRIRQSGAGAFIKDRNPTIGEIKMAQEALAFAHREALEGEVDLLILDEISHAINNGLINLDTIIDFIKNKPSTMELVLTGRNMPERVIHHADLVSETRQIKHPFLAGESPRRGVEY